MSGQAWECPHCGTIHSLLVLSCWCGPPTITLTVSGDSLAQPSPYRSVTTMAGNGTSMPPNTSGTFTGLPVPDMGGKYSTALETAERLEMVVARLTAAERDIAAHQQALVELARVVGLKEMFPAESFPDLAARLAKMGEEAAQTASAGVPIEPADPPTARPDYCIPHPGIVECRHWLWLKNSCTVFTDPWYCQNAGYQPEQREEEMEQRRGEAKVSMEPADPEDTPELLRCVICDSVILPFGESMRMTRFGYAYPLCAKCSKQEPADPPPASESTGGQAEDAQVLDMWGVFQIEGWPWCYKMVEFSGGDAEVVSPWLMRIGY